MPNTSQFVVPFALDKDENMILPEDAKRNNEYFCPSCKERLICKQGEIKAWHLAHTHTTDCQGESEEHYKTKMLVKKYFEDGVFREIRKIFYCGVSKCPGFFHLDYPGFDEVQLEKTLPNGLRADVCLCCNGEAVFVIEVCHTNEVSEDKSNELNSLGVPFVEVSTTEPFKEGSLNIINENIFPCRKSVPVPIVLIPTMKTHIGVFGRWGWKGMDVCPECERKAYSVTKKMVLNLYNKRLREGREREKIEMECDWDKVLVYQPFKGKDGKIDIHISWQEHDGW